MVAVDGERLITGRAGEGWRKVTGREERGEIWERKGLCEQGRKER
jgi:hypothetical protein